MTKKPKKPRNGNGYSLVSYPIGFTVNLQNIDIYIETKEIEDLHRWLGDCIRYIKYRQRKK